MPALGTRHLAEAALASGAREAFRARGFDLDRLSRAADSPRYAAGLTGREVAGLAYGLHLDAEHAAASAYGGEWASAWKPRPTRESMARLLPMPDGWWATPSVTAASLLGEEPANLAEWLGPESLADGIRVASEARLCALAGERISELWGLNAAAPIQDGVWLEALDDAHQRLAKIYVPHLFQEEGLDLYHVTHLPKMEVAQAIEIAGAGVGIVVSTGPGQWAQLFVRCRKSGELLLSLQGLKADWREARWQSGFDGIVAVGRSLSSLAEDFARKCPAWAGNWKACALRMPSGLLSDGQGQALAAV